jgi:Fe-S cluster assembly ATPase SufC
MKNGGPKKQAKSPDITHHKDPNRTKKAWWRPSANEVQITPQMEFKKRPPIEGFSGGQYKFSEHVHQGMLHPTKLDQKRGLFPEKKAYFKDFTKFISTV